MLIALKYFVQAGFDASLNLDARCAIGNFRQPKPQTRGAEGRETSINAPEYVNETERQGKITPSPQPYKTPLEWEPPRGHSFASMSVEAEHRLNTPLPPGQDIPSIHGNSPSSTPMHAHSPSVKIQARQSAVKPTLQAKGKPIPNTVKPGGRLPLQCFPNRHNVIQMMRFSGVLSDGKTKIKTKAGTFRDISGEVKWPDDAADLSDGMTVEYEWTPAAGVTIIYGRDTSLAARVDEADAKAPAQPTFTDFIVDEAIIEHVWERHTLEGIFHVKALKSATSGSDIALFHPDANKAGIGVFLKALNPKDAWKWQHKNEKWYGTFKGIEIQVTSLDGTTGVIHTCYPPGTTVSKATLEAALKASADLSGFKSAVGDY